MQELFNNIDKSIFKALIDNHPQSPNVEITWEDWKLLNPTIEPMIITMWRRTSKSKQSSTIKPLTDQLEYLRKKHMFLKNDPTTIYKLPVLSASYVVSISETPSYSPLRRCGLNASGGKFIMDSDERVRCRSMAWCMAAGCNMGGLWTGVPGDKMMIFVVGRELYKWPKWRWSTSQHMHCQLLMFFLWSEEPVEPVHQKIRIVLINNCSVSIYVKRHTMATWGKILCIHIYIYTYTNYNDDTPPGK